jgi:hypothetical protein
MMTVGRRLVLALAAAALLAGAPAAQTGRSLSLESIYDPARSVDFSGTPPPAISWLDGDTYLIARREGRGTEWRQVEAASGRESAWTASRTRQKSAWSARPCWAFRSCS